MTNLDFAAMDLTLKDGRAVIIRTARLSDAENLLSTVKTYIADSDHIPKLLQEITLTVAQEEEWIDSFLKSANSILLVAEHNGKIIGNIDLTGSRRQIMQHTGVIGMGMLSEWRNCGLGTAMLRAVVNWAKRNPILELLWLQVYSANTPGIRLYERMGFRESGYIRKFFKKDGTHFDCLTMTLNVEADN